MSKQTEEIRRRLAAATPGPWRVGHDGPSKAVLSGAHPRHGMLAFHTFPRTVTNLWGFDDLEEENAELIAHAPTDLAFLLAENERLEQEVANLRDSPKLDGTPYEHPAYRRGDDHGSAVALQTKQQNERLCAALAAYCFCGVCSHPLGFDGKGGECFRCAATALRTTLDAAGRVIEAYRFNLEPGDTSRRIEDTELAYAEAMKGVK